jgi:hypothetical protein
LARAALELGRLDRDRARAVELGARRGVAVAQREARHPADPRVEVVAQPAVRRLDVLLGRPGARPSASNARSKSIEADPSPLSGPDMGGMPGNSAASMECLGRPAIPPWGRRSSS